MLLEHWRSAVEKRFPVLYCPFVSTASWHLLTGLLLSEYALTSTRACVYGQVDKRACMSHHSAVAT